MKNKQKGFASILLVLFGMIVIFGGIYIYTQKSPENVIESEFNSESTSTITTDEAKTQNNTAAKIDTPTKSDQPSVTVVYPNGGEMYTKGTSIDIKWSATNIGSQTLEINLYKSDGSFMYNLSSSVSSALGTGTYAPYSWRVPTVNSPGGRTIESGQYKIKVCASNNSGICDMSDGNFTITDSSASVNKGIIITSVKPNDIVKLPVTIEGYLDGNGWGANEGEVGMVEVFDANNKIIGSELVRTTSNWLEFPTYFSAMVGDRQMMSYIQTNTGYIKITSNRAKNGDSSKSISIPVRFK